MSFTLGYVGFTPVCVRQFRFQVHQFTSIYVSFCWFMLVGRDVELNKSVFMHVYVVKDGLKVDIWVEIHNMIQECAMLKTYGK